MRVVLIFLCMVACPWAKACLNYDLVRLDGVHVPEFGEDIVPYGATGEWAVEEHAKLLKETYDRWKSTGDIAAYSDYGVELIFAGRYAEAKALFEEIERMAPGRYSTAANLGTVLELLGDNEQALIWIKKAVAIDPASHKDSEWIHVRILEVKIAGEESMTSRALIGTDFGNDVIPKSKLDTAKLKELRDALFYQLCERMTLVPPKNSIVALLLFEYGNICAITNDVTNALRVYDKARLYGYTSSVLDERYEKFIKMQRGTRNEYDEQSKENATIVGPPPPPSNKRFFAIGLGLICIGGLVILALSWPGKK